MKPIYALLALAAVPLAGRADDIEFNRDVRPIFSDKCFACHGPDPKHRKADLRLDVEKDAKEAGVIVPGKPGQGALIDRITAKDEMERKQRGKSGKKLTPADVHALRPGGLEGAKWSPPGAYVPPKRPPIPMVKDANRSAGWTDRFVLARLEREKLSPSPDADRRTLCRRLYFDITGLPPTPDEVDA